MERSRYGNEPKRFLGPMILSAKREVDDRDNLQSRKNSYTKASQYCAWIAVRKWEELCLGCADIAALYAGFKRRGRLWWSGSKIIGTIRLGNELNLKSLSEWLMSRTEWLEKDHGNDRSVDYLHGMDCISGLYLISALGWSDWIDRIDSTRLYLISVLNWIDWIDRVQSDYTWF